MRLRRLLSGLGAALALVALLVGAPAFLWIVAGWPLPHGIPTWSQVTTFLNTRGLPDYLLRDILAVIGWLAWLDLLVSTLVEFVGAVRHRMAKRPLIVRWLSPLTAYLVATILLAVGPSGTRHVSRGTTAHVQATPPAVTQILDSPPHRQVVPSPSASTQEDVEVTPGDTLWGIAQTRMHDPFLWPRIWELNKDHVEDDGRVFTDPSLIYPGWELEVPVASPPSPSLPTPGNGSVPATVPLPSTPAPTAGPCAATPAATPAPSPAGAPALPTPAHGETPTHPAPPPATHSQGRPAVAEGDWLVTLAEGGLVGLGLAAAVLGALSAARRYERRRWRVGDRSQPRTRILALGPNLTRLRRAVSRWQARQPSASEDEQCRDTQELLATLPKPDHLPGTIPVGLREDGAGDVVVDLDELSGLCLAGRGGKAVARALAVSMLATHPDAWAELVVMDGFRGFELIPGLQGTPYVDTYSDIGSLLRRVDGELVRRRRELADREADDFRAAATGPDPMSATLAILPAQAVDLMRDPARLTEIVREGRRLGLGVLVVGTPSQMTAELRELVIDADGTVAADQARLIGGARSLYHFSQREAAELLRVFAAGSGPDVVPDVSPEEEAPALPPADVSGSGGPPPDGTEPAVMVTGTPVDGHGAKPVEVAVFGGLRVLVHGQEVLEGIPGSGREVLALLVVRGRPLTKEEGIDAIGDGEMSDYFHRYWGAGVRKTRATLRGLIGDDTCNPILRHGDRYELDRGLVDSDYWRLQSGMRAARLTTDPPDKMRLLEEATRGIQGQPFHDGDFRWLEIEQEDVRRQGMEALEELAELRAGEGNLDGAIAALEQAMTLDPNPVEDLFRRMMLIQHRFGDDQAARETYKRLSSQLRKRLDAVPEPETEELIAAIRSSSRQSVG